MSDVLRRRSAAVVAVLAAFALVLQYVILIGNTLATVGPMFATVRFFTYFTILSNLLVLLVTGSTAFAPRSRLGQWFAQPVVPGAVALYIGVTFLIYATVLRHLWQPQGAQWWADSSLHYAVPVAYLLWWLIAAPHGALRWGDVGRWLLFPLVYLVWVCLRGMWAREYPYPFLDLNVLAPVAVVRNCGGVLLLFVVAGVGLVAIDRWRSRVKP